MGELREIVDVDAVGKLFTLLALALPVVGGIIGAGWGGRQGQARRGALYGLLMGMLGPLNWVLWHLYNTITDSVGLDTVRNVMINFVLFVAVGLFIGFGIGTVLRRQALTVSEETGEGMPSSQPLEAVADREQGR